MIRNRVLESISFSQVLVWETRVPPGGVKPAQKKDKEIIHPMGVPLTFKHLENIWKPLLRVRAFLCFISLFWSASSCSDNIAKS